jgi:hypothetical protein
VYNVKHAEQNIGTVNKYIAERLATFERKVLRRMFGLIKVNENWKTRYNEELRQLFRDLFIYIYIYIYIL